MTVLFRVLSGDEELTVSKVIAGYELETFPKYRWDFQLTRAGDPITEGISFNREIDTVAAIAAWMYSTDPESIERAEKQLSQNSAFERNFILHKVPDNIKENPMTWAFPIERGRIFLKEGGWGFTVRLKDDPEMSEYVVPTTISSGTNARAAMYNYVRMVNSRLEGKK